MDKFSELKAAAMAATPGSWIAVNDDWSDGDHANITTKERGDGGIIAIAQVEGGGFESGFDEEFAEEQRANAAFIAAANPAVILDLLEELEAKDKRIAELGRSNQSQDDHINQQQDRIDSLEKTNAGLGRELAAAGKQLVYSRDAIASWERKAISNFEECATMSQRIEELQKRLATPVRLPDAYQTSCSESEKYLCPVEVAEAIRAAGFTVGDE